MTAGAYHGVVLNSWPSEYYPDGVQHVVLVDGRALNIPPIEYTVKHGDRLVVETSPDRCDEACELWRIHINDTVWLLIRPLWDAYYQDHPRPWLGEYVEGGKILTIRGEVRHAPNG